MYKSSQTVLKGTQMSTARQQSCWKVMYSLVCICWFTREGGAVLVQGPGPAFRDTFKLHRMEITVEEPSFPGLAFDWNSFMSFNKNRWNKILNYIYLNHEEGIFWIYNVECTAYVECTTNKLTIHLNQRKWKHSFHRLSMKTITIFDRVRFAVHMFHKPNFWEVPDSRLMVYHVIGRILFHGTNC